MLLIDPDCLGLLLALALDALLGDPGWLWRRVPHPVVLLGRAIAGLEEHWLDADAQRHLQAQRESRDAKFPCDRRERAVVALAVQELCMLAPLGWRPAGLAMSTLIADGAVYMIT